MNLPGYDAWLEKPYQDRANECSTCPECGEETVVSTKYEAQCTNDACDYEDEADFESIAEARAEAREPSGDVW